MSLQAYADLLGEMPDCELAARAEVSTDVIRKARHDAGIPPYALRTPALEAVMDIIVSDLCEQYEPVDTSHVVIVAGRRLELVRRLLLWLEEDGLVLNVAEEGEEPLWVAAE